MLPEAHAGRLESSSLMRAQRGAAIALNKLCQRSIVHRMLPMGSQWIQCLPKPAALVALQYMHVANKEYTDGDLGESKSSNTHAKSRSGEIECSRWNQSATGFPIGPV